jgi:hypothetical protein
MTQKISSVNIEASTLSSFTGPLISTVSIANSSYVIVDDTAVSNAGGYAVISGNNFVSGAQVLFGSTSATSVTYVNSSTLRVEVPALTAGSYVMYVQNPDGSTAIRLNGITSSPTPVWGTDSALTQQDAGVAFSISLAASSDSNVTFALSSGSTLPPGTTLAANGVFSGTVTIEEETTYNFSVDAIDAENQDTLRSFSVTVATGDANYKNTVLHLNGETTNNTWITDASTNGFALTVNGDTRPMAFSPYETVWSNSFDGTDDYLTIPTNSAFNLPGDFTMECWAYWNTLPGNSMLLDTYVAGDNGSYQLYWRSTGSSIAFYTVGDGVILQDPSSSTIVTNRWYHIAVSRSGTTARLFIDGVQKASATLTRDLTHDNSFTIGTQLATLTNDINGYISNVRLVKGTALYTSNFTPSTTPLTAIENTVLLTCQSNRFIDNSTNNFAITVGNNTLVSSFGPFVETDVTTGSTYFDGTGDYLSLPNINFASNDFCVECWFYWTTNDPTSYSALFGKGATDSSEDFCLLFKNTEFYFDWGNSATFASRATTINTHRWYHVALARSSGVVKIFLNGIQQGADISVATIPNNHTTWYIGLSRISASILFTGGYISNVRFVNGSAVYTSTFTPPTTPLTAIANTSLLTLQSRIGENNNRFVDTSGINNLITRNGNATQGTFSPFAVTSWSNYFDGAGDYLTIPNSTSLQLGSSDFTIEAWVFPTAIDSGATSVIMGKYNSSPNLEWFLGITSTVIRIRYSINGTTVVGNIDASYAVPLNQWTHIAVSRIGNVLRFFANGTQIGTDQAFSNTFYQGTGTFEISGANNDDTTRFIGYISNIRVVKGNAVYTSTFTPSTTLLTAVSNTSLLTCQSNRLIDNSTNNFTITKVGDVSVQPFSPFKPTNSWSPTTVGGSMLLDGTGDFLTVPNNTVLNPGTQDFVMEAWVYIKALTGANQGINGKGTAGTDGYSFYVTNALVLSFIWNGTGGATITAGTLKLNAWHHVAVVRNSGVIRLYLDGVGAGSSTSCTTDITTTGVKYVGQARGANPVNGYMSGYRMIKGELPTGYDATASTITVPTAPFETVKSTSLLLNSTNGGIIDYTGKNNLETVGDAKIRNNVVKYGNGSMYFDGTGDYLLVPSDPSLDFGTGDFTIEFWLNLANVTSTWQAIISRAYNITGGWRLYKNDGTAELRWYAGGTSVVLTSSSGIANNVWSHVAVVRNGTTLTIYVDGTNRGSATNSTNYTPGNYAVEIGSGVVTSAYPVTGYIDDLRITKGVARYTANFTPPTSAFKTK